MAAPKTGAGTVQAVAGKSPGARGFDLVAADTEAAESVGFVLAGSLADRVARLVQVQNTAARLAVEGGYLLLSIKAEMPHGDFEAGLESIGLTSQRASDLMRMAKFVTSLPPDRRAQLLKLDKTKLIMLSTADAETVQVLLEDGVTDFETLSSRELLKKLNYSRTALQKSEHENSNLRKRLERSASGMGADVPPLLAEMRSRIGLLSQQFVGAVDGVREVHAALMALRGDSAGDVWVDPTLRLGLAACAHMQTQVVGLLALYTRELPDGDYAPVPQSYLGDAEVESLAQRFQELVAMHRLLGAQHDVRKTNAQRAGPGRPLAEPTAPAKKKPRAARYDSRGAK